MSYSDAIISGVLLGIFIALSVGPTLFAIIQYSMHHSYKAGIAFILGVSLSDIMYVFLANVATGWLEFLKEHQKIIGFVGAGLFVAIGLYGLLGKYKPRRPQRGKKIIISSATFLRLFGSGFLMNTLNPAAVILWMGAAIKVSNYEFVMEKVIFFGICLGIVLAADVTKVFLAQKIRSWLTLRKIMYINRTSAVCILIFGIILFLRVFFYH